MEVLEWSATPSPWPAKVKWQVQECPIQIKSGRVTEGQTMFQVFTEKKHSHLNWTIRVDFKVFSSTTDQVSI